MASRLSVLVVAGVFVIAAAGAGGEVAVAPAESGDALTLELLERLRWGREIHEEFASGVGCTECHARDPRPLPSALRGEFDPALERGPSR